MLHKSKIYKLLKIYKIVDILVTNFPTKQNSFLIMSEDNRDFNSPCINLFTGQQEYSARYAGLTTAIVMAIIIPLVLALAFVAYKFIQKRKQDAEEDDEEYEDSTINEKSR